MNANEQKRVGLALGGGVARAPAHVGVLSVLARAGIPIDCVAGTSAGALVGAFYCAGVDLQQLQKITQGITWRDLARPVWPREGFVSFARLESWLVKILGDLTFADLAIPFAVVATDLENGQAVSLRDGRLAPAVRASCSVPGIVTPAMIGGRVLGDGGVANNLPVSVARAMGADYVIGVDLFKPSYRRRGPLGRGFSAIETLVRNAGGGLAGADCLISPELGGVSYLRLSQTAQLISLGEQAAEKELPCIQAGLNL